MNPTALLDRKIDLSMPVTPRSTGDLRTKLYASSGEVPHNRMTFALKPRLGFGSAIQFAELTKRPPWLVYLSSSYRALTNLYRFSGKCMGTTDAAGEATYIAARAASPLAWIWVRMPNHQ